MELQESNQSVRIYFLFVHYFIVWYNIFSPKPQVVVGDDSQRRKRKASTCTACGKEGHNSRNKICQNYSERIPISRVHVETSSVLISPVQNVQESF